MLTPLLPPRGPAYLAGHRAGQLASPDPDGAALTRLLLQRSCTALEAGVHLLAGERVVLHALGCELATAAPAELTLEAPVLVGCVACHSAPLADRLRSWVEGVLARLHRVGELPRGPAGEGSEGVRDRAYGRIECDHRWGAESAGAPDWPVLELSPEHEQWLTGLADALVERSLDACGVGAAIRGELAVLTTPYLLTHCCPELVADSLPLRSCAQGVLVVCTADELALLQARPSWLQNQFALLAGVDPEVLCEDTQRWMLAVEILGEGPYEPDALEAALTSAAEALAPAPS